MKVEIKPHTRNIINNLMEMVIVIDELDIKQEIRIDTLQSFELVPYPNEESLDILYFSIYISSIDKLIMRNLFADNWTRNIEVNIPVSNPSLWNGKKEFLENALNFLSGDIWNFSFYKLDKKYFHINELPIEQTNESIKNICLFSGGLDSLIGAIDLIEDNNDILFVSYYDSHGALQTGQKYLFDALKKESNKNLYLNQFTFNRFSSTEDSTRTRSILFLGLSLYLAINLKVKQIITPENGLISINLPLSPSRSGANSTRTMHPYFIKSIEKALYELGHEIKIKNPYIDKTKGEMLLESKKPKLLKHLYKNSISCSHPSIAESKLGKKHCGHCMPCIIRRASINRYNKKLDIGSDYGIDIFNESSMRLEQDGVVPKNIRALLIFLSNNYNKKDLKKQMNKTVKNDNTILLVDMLYSGYEELKLLIRDKGTIQMKKIVFGE